MKSLLEESGSVCKLASPALPVHAPTSTNTKGSSLTQYAHLPSSASVVCPLPPGILQLSHKYDQHSYHLTLTVLSLVSPGLNLNMTEQTDHPDSAAQLLRVLSQQGILLGQHNICLQSLEQQQASTNSAVVEISRNLQTIQNQLSAGSSNQPTASPLAACPNPVTYQSISPPPPEPLSGDLEKRRGFLLQCTLVFQQARGSFLDDTSRISYMIGLLRGQALRWAEAFIDETTIQYYALTQFLDLFKKTFSLKHSDKTLKRFGISGSTSAP
ncbi:hypothetical protein CRENBAI_026147 [Crenichthys baileyi]|uniref:DUF4939 domain-containing protein n=1 Tax=Crenichthys baileyi TaxID=28760 RepID=A0AAV9RTG1_9TELE